LSSQSSSSHHIHQIRSWHCALHLHRFQVIDHDNYGISFDGLVFWQAGRAFALGEQTTGFTDLNLGTFVKPAEGRYALNNGEYGGFVFTAFQVLLVRPTEGLCSRSFGLAIIALSLSF
jgi:hypothetical protein